MCLWIDRQSKNTATKDAERLTARTDRANRVRLIGGGGYRQPLVVGAAASDWAADRRRAPRRVTFRGAEALRPPLRGYSSALA